MTKVNKIKVKCAKCGAESEQLLVFSTNFILYTKDSSKKLMKYQQVCPKCNYTNFDISVFPNTEKK